MERTAVAFVLFVLAWALHIQAAPTPGNALSATYYDGLCGPFGTRLLQFKAQVIVSDKVRKDPTLIPALTRMCFHDAFVRGAEASILLDFNSSFPQVEKNAIPNNPSLRGYEVIDAVKEEMERACPGVVSCADILQESVRVALRTLLFGGLWYEIEYGRRDGTVSLESEALTQLPPPIFNYDQLLAIFRSKGFTAQELMALSGAHTFGVAHCGAFAKRLYNFSGDGTGTDPALDRGFAADLKRQCPPNASADTTVPQNYLRPDPRMQAFDSTYYRNIMEGKALFTSDKALNDGDPSRVRLYAWNNGLFRDDFGKAVVKMTKLDVKLYPEGEVRTNCRRRN